MIFITRKEIHENAITSKPNLVKSKSIDFFSSTPKMEVKKENSDFLETDLINEKLEQNEFFFEHDKLMEKLSYFKFLESELNKNHLNVNRNTERTNLSKIQKIKINNEQ